jgi:hypothetical protein
VGVPTEDFNLIYKDEDKNNSNYNKAMMGGFRSFINDLALKEIPIHGRKFTWSNQYESPTLVRLDRVLCTVEWEDPFPDCLLQSLATNDSDHCLSFLVSRTTILVLGAFILKLFGQSWRVFRNLWHPDGIRYWLSLALFLH